MRFSPRIVMITGASSGIGRALAVEYAAPGMRLGLTARRRNLLEEVALECRRRGALAWVRAADVCDRAAMEATGREFLAWAGGVDLVIANAGGGVPDSLLDPAVLELTLRLNVTSVAHTFAPLLPALRAAQRGQLAAVASLAGYRGIPYAPSYAASKAALISYMESLRIQLGGEGIGVSTICPGYVRTPLTAGNPYKPWLLEPQAAARIIRRGLAGGRSQIVFPWQLALLVRLMHHAPNRLYDAFVRAFTTRRARAAQPQPPS